MLPVNLSNAIKPVPGACWAGVACYNIKYSDQNVGNLDPASYSRSNQNATLLFCLYCVFESVSFPCSVAC